jgi:octaprenyl-diphosphate synthase
VIRFKTAKLFEAAVGSARSWPALARNRGGLSRATACIVGTAFQLIDDVLDYSGDSPRPARISVMTSPRARRRCRSSMSCATGPSAGGRRAHAIESGGITISMPVMQAIRETDALDVRARRRGGRGEALAQDAIGCLEDSRYRESLIHFASFAISHAPNSSRVRFEMASRHAKLYSMGPDGLRRSKCDSFGV